MSSSDPNAGIASRRNLALTSGNNSKGNHVMTNTNPEPAAVPAVDATPAAVAPQPVVVNVTQAAPANALPPKSVGVAYVFWLLLGLFGGHRFYIGKIGTGILFLLTGGILGIGWVIDAFTLASQVRRVNQMRAAGIG